MRKTSKFISVLLAVLMICSILPFGAFADGANVAKIGETEYANLAEAIAAATEGQTVEIIAADTYKLPNISNNITVKGAVEGVVIDATGSKGSSICSVPKGVTFENLTFNFGQTSYHGFQHAGNINMNGCTLNGLFFSYGDMNFTECKFVQTSKEYMMWAYGKDLSFKNCNFDGQGKFINVYCESNSTTYNITAEGCTFNSSVNNKAAFNVKETCGSNVLMYNVNINNCTTNENFPAASDNGTLTVFSGLVQVDDRVAGGTENGGEIKVNVDGAQIYTTPEKACAAKIGDVKYDTLAEAVAAAKDGDTIDVMSDVSVDSKIEAKANNLTINGNGKTVTGADGAGFIVTGDNVSFKDLTIKDCKIPEYNATIYFTRQDANSTMTVDGCTITGNRCIVVADNVGDDGKLIIKNSDLTGTYPFNCQTGKIDIEVSDSTLHGWTSYGKNTKSASFTNCDFNMGSGKYDCIASYANTTFDGCKFDKDFEIYAQIDASTDYGFQWNFDDCTKDGKAITVVNFTDNFADEDENICTKSLVSVDGDKLMHTDSASEEGYKYNTNPNEWFVDRVLVTEEGDLFVVGAVCEHPDTELKNAKDATCTEDGYTGDEICTVCGGIAKEGKAIPALGHDTELKNAKAATCTEAGYTGDEVCKTCGETIKSGEAISALGHDTEVKGAKAATETEDGYTGDKVCKTCGETLEKGKAIPATGHTCPFTDIKNSGYHDWIEQAEKAGIINGYPDKTYRPNANVTRAQFITMLYRAVGSPEASGKLSFTDNGSIAAPYMDAVVWGVENNIILGYTDNTFRPDQEISRAQMATFMFRYMKNVAKYDFGKVTETSFADKADIANPYVDAVNAIVSVDIMNGTTKTTFAPNATANRGMAATVMLRMYNLLSD